MGTPSVFPMFLKRGVGVGGGTIIVGALAVSIQDNIAVALEQEINVDKEGQLLSAAGLEITVAVEGELTVDLESC